MTNIGLAFESSRPISRPMLRESYIIVSGSNPRGTPVSREALDPGWQILEAIWPGFAATKHDAESLAAVLVRTAPRPPSVQAGRMPTEPTHKCSSASLLRTKLHFTNTLGAFDRISRKQAARSTSHAEVSVLAAGGQITGQIRQGWHRPTPSS